MTVSACVVNHQGVHRLPGVLAALEASTRPPAEIVVVDSGSTDGSVEFLRREHPGVRVVALGRNAGPAVARNRGFDAARHDRILFVDNDVQVETDCLAALDRALSTHGDAVLAMPRVLDAADPSRIHFEGAHAHCLGQLIPRLRDEEDDLVDEGIGTPSAGGPREAPTVVAVGSMISACFLIDRARADGLRFDPAFEFNYEDHDFGLRCRSAGLPLLAVPGARCRHGSGTPGYSVRAGMDEPVDRVRRMVVARWLIIRRCYALRTVLVLAPALLLFELVQLAWLARRRRLDAWRDARRALRRLAAEIARARAEVARRRRVPDGRLLRGGPLPVRPSVARGALERGVLAGVGALTSAWWRLVRGLV